MNCEKCGKVIPETLNYCPNCRINNHHIKVAKNSKIGLIIATIFCIAASFLFLTFIIRNAEIRNYGNRVSATITHTIWYSAWYTQVNFITTYGENMDARIIGSGPLTAQRGEFLDIYYMPNEPTRITMANTDWVLAIGFLIISVGAIFMVIILIKSLKSPNVKQNT